MILTNHPEGIVLSVRAQPGSKRDEMRGIQNDALKVCVTQVPEKGKANKAIRKQLAASLKLRVSQIELLSGETSSQKKFLLRNVDEEMIQKRLNELGRVCTNDDLGENQFQTVFSE